jgi:phosphate transport system substrate-binding protein
LRDEDYRGRIKQRLPAPINATSMKQNLAGLFSKGNPICLITLLSLIVCLTGCSDSGKQETAAKNEEAKVVIKGSNTVGEELAPRLIAEFKKDHPTAAFEIETKGSGSGFWGVIAGVCDMAAASRTPIVDEQQQAKARGIEFKDYVIGSYGVAVIANAANGVANLTRDQVRDIFTGAIQNWKQVGGSDAAIRLYVRDPISGTYLGFREMALQDKAYTTNNATELKSYKAIVEAIAKDPNAIGYSSIPEASEAGVKTISVEGIAPSAGSIKDGKYPYARTLHFYTNKEKETAPATEFIQFVQSPKGQAIVAQSGNVPRS